MARRRTDRSSHPLTVVIVGGIIALVGTLAAAIISRSGRGDEAPPQESARTASPDPAITNEPSNLGISVDRLNSSVHANRLVVTVRGTARNLGKEEVVYAVLDPDPPGAAAPGDHSLGWFTSKATVPNASTIWDAKINAPAEAAAGFTVFAVQGRKPCSNCSGGTWLSRDDVELLGPSTPNIIARSAAVHDSAGT
jgi:hypothetical protein